MRASPVMPGRRPSLDPVTIASAISEVRLLTFSAAGRIDRTGASSVAGQSGRLVYAALETERLGLMRPGDFMTVRVEEPSLTRSTPAARWTGKTQRV